MKDIIDPWGRMDVKDYGKLSREFGIDKLELSAPNEVTIVVNSTGKVVVKRQ